MAILIWLMIVDFQSIKNADKNPKGLFVTWITFWLIKPFTIYGIASEAFITPELAKLYLAGAALLGAAPCTAMVFVWSTLTKGDLACIVLLVANKDLIILFTLVSIVKFLLCGKLAAHCPDCGAADFADLPDFCHRLHRLSYPEAAPIRSLHLPE